MPNAFTSPEDQLRFFVSCIKHSGEFKPDWSAVAKDMDLVSASAAQQRYGRMIVKFGKGSDKTDAADSSEPSITSSPAKKKGIPKKPLRKAAADGNDEEEVPQSPTKRRKTGSAREVEKPCVKTEEDQDLFA